MIPTPTRPIALSFKDERPAWGRSLQHLTLDMTQVGAASARSTPAIDLLSPAAALEVEPLEESGSVFCLFRLRFDNLHEVSVGARASTMEEIVVTLSSNQAASIQLRHGPMLQSCTVTCLATGDTRSGPPACIECTNGPWIVTICC